MTSAVIAGWGDLPVAAARELKSRGDRVVAVALSEAISVDMTPHADVVHRRGVGQVGSVLKLLETEKVDRVVFAGKIDKRLLYGNLKLDLTAMKLIGRLANRKDDTIMLLIVEEVESRGFSVMSQIDVFRPLLEPAGVLSKKKPTDAMMRDAAFGYSMAKAMGGLDIGQTVVVKDTAVMAVEAIEGTDECVRRGCTLAGKGAVVVKTAKPSQDPRFDVPTIGIDTLRNLADNNGYALVIEAGKTFIVNRDACIEYANRHGLVLLSYTEGTQ